MLVNQTILKELSGLERPTAICRWLDHLSIPYILGADKWPRVLEAILLSKMGDTLKDSRKEPKVRRRNG